ncbi:thiosulfate sulfurtransferase 16 [Gracilaria domingensis]|nr:thiosulfate sulfurtransferase 16 [Gracilaria domingensis]
MALPLTRAAARGAFVARAAPLRSASSLPALCARTAVPRRVAHTMTTKLSPQALHDKMSQPSAVYVDVRTPAEFAAGHVPRAINVSFTTADMKPLPSFVDDFRAAVGDATDVTVGCKSGKRSSMAIAKLNEAGVQGLMELEGGFDNWASDTSLPVDK